MKRYSGKHPMNDGMDAWSSRTLFRLANLHWDVCERNLDRPWSSVLVIKLLTVIDRAAVDEWVDVGEVQVSLTGADERGTSMGQTAVSPGISMTSSGVGRQDGPILLETVGEIVLNAAGGFFG